ncbi:hypothetical protein [Streptomyces sp. NPDC053728]|uniref:hypothetical protein n=1 Tax=Streptomyces sp. NPDC053728 TaxID=3155534 RepID=UPI00344A31E0
MREVRRGRTHARPSAPGLAQHLRTVLWGPAEFVGLPARLLAQGMVVGAVATAAIGGVGFAGMWVGPRTLVTGEAGLIVVAAVMVYLAVLRAGRILIGLVAVLGACLAFMAPDVAAGVALQHRGQVESARVGSVGIPSGRGRTLCSITQPVGAVTGATVWRGCGKSITPGDTLPVVYDPERRAPTRGVAAPGELRAAEDRLAGVGAALVAGCTVAVVRSFRLTAPSRPARGG